MSSHGQSLDPNSHFGSIRSMCPLCHPLNSNAWTPNSARLRPSRGILGIRAITIAQSQPHLWKGLAVFSSRSRPDDASFDESLQRAKLYSLSLMGEIGCCGVRSYPGPRGVFGRHPRPFRILASVLLVPVRQVSVLKVLEKSEVNLCWVLVGSLHALLLPGSKPTRTYLPHGQAQV